VIHSPADVELLIQVVEEFRVLIYNSTDEWKALILVAESIIVAND
jgi:hypothetical protein